ncbi:hypothetical protein AC625_18690 [Peribacillus loiseleuriae]|uniref:Uncharacterized protein n=1 Tax=Peribacillus loiseleuriae TaxID=1679170 RepID=A0A0K9GX98_9BACI|nr:hypothetical protein AC625_18690 [Peribacillus loiseleuriae]
MFLIPQGPAFGFPFTWLTYHGKESLETSFQILKWSRLKQTNFHKLPLLVNSFVLYYFLILLNKGLNAMMNDERKL